MAILEVFDIDFLSMHLTGLYEVLDAFTLAIIIIFVIFSIILSNSVLLKPVDRFFDLNTFGVAAKFNLIRIHCTDCPFRSHCIFLLLLETF